MTHWTQLIGIFSVSSTENLFIFITAFILVAITTVNLTVGITGNFEEMMISL